MMHATLRLTQVFHGRSGRHQCGQGIQVWNTLQSAVACRGATGFFEHHLLRPGRYNDFNAFGADSVVRRLSTSLRHVSQGTRQADEAAHRFEIVDEQVAQLNDRLARVLILADRRPFSAAAVSAIVELIRRLLLFLALA